MGIFGAMTTAVSGLRAQSYSLENISGNIANSQTTGFKRVDTNFVDLIPDTPPNRGLAGSVTAYSRLTNTIQGDLQPTSISTNMAINGEGYFVVGERTGTAPTGSPEFSSARYYTRRGDFTLDRATLNANGRQVSRLVNGAGNYLRGDSIDPVSGTRYSTQSGVIEIAQSELPARTTSNIDYGASLPSRPATPSTVPSDTLSDRLAAAPAAPPTPAPAVPAGYNPRSTASPQPAGAGFVAGSDQSRFLAQTIEGGSIIAYNQIGAPVDVQFRWGKVDNNTWNLFYQTNSNAPNDNTPAWVNVGGGTPITFDATGALNSAASLTIPDLRIDGLAVGPVRVNFANGLRQFPSTSGAIEGVAVQQDGFPTGDLDSIAVGADGLIVGNYTNGRIVPIGEVQVAQFTADNALKRRDGGTYQETFESGPPSMSLASANIAGGHVENSNTDIADEFSKMIITQQAYSANTRVVSTAQQMMQDVINIIR